MSVPLSTQPPPAPRKPLEWLSVPLGYALRRAFHKGYDLAALRADLMAGAVVGVVALPLSMALAIAVGVPPQHGLYTAIIAGAIVALLGGCKFQVTGPTAAFVVILAPIVTTHGLSGLLIASFMAGVLLVAMGFARFGSFIQYIPHPVTTGFTTGIATVIATLQIKDVFGLRIAKMPEHYLDRLGAMWSARGTVNVLELGVAASTLALLIFVPRWVKRVPAPLIAIGAVTVVSALLHALVPAFAVSTIGTRFDAGIPAGLPTPHLPWEGGRFDFALIRELFPAAFAIAMLGAIESLLSAVIADGMTNTKHESNSELVALGIGNMIAPLFGGIAATGALARTATNIRAGARSPIAAVTHSIVLLLAVLVLAPLLGHVPMAALAALLLVVAWNMSELPSFVRLCRIAPKSDVSVLLTCFVLTVAFDMVIAVSVGFVLAAIMFMRRMAELTETRLELDASRDGSMLPLPKGAVLYEINGPLFFGAAQKAMGTLGAMRDDGFSVLVIHLGRVPVIDATGLVALEGAIANVLRRRKNVVLAGPLPRPRSIFDNARLEVRYPGLVIASNLASAAVVAESLTNGEHPASFADAVSSPA
jgi:sulfate permease, SulP family